LDLRHRHAFGLSCLCGGHSLTPYNFQLSEPFLYFGHFTNVSSPFFPKSTSKKRPLSISR
jgi:hypothetical protein